MSVRRFICLLSVCAAACGSDAASVLTWNRMRDGGTSTPAIVDANTAADANLGASAGRTGTTRPPESPIGGMPPGGPPWEELPPRGSRDDAGLPVCEGGPIEVRPVTPCVGGPPCERICSVGDRPCLCPFDAGG